MPQGVTKRAGRNKNAGVNGQADGTGEGKARPTKAVFEFNKKKEAGVSDLTLISKITNEAINDNLKLRFENAQIYVCLPPIPWVLRRIDFDAPNRHILAMYSSQSIHSETVRFSAHPARFEVLTRC